MALIDKYSQQELQQIVQQSKNLNEVIDKPGYSTHGGNNYKTVQTRLDLYSIDTSHFIYKKPVKRNTENIFIKNSTASQQTLRRWYIKGQYTNYECSICGQGPCWQGKELTLILDHIDGQNHNNELSNLRWVCPNCNQQLETTGYRKMRVANLRKKYYCIDCGKEIYASSERCAECYSKSRRIVNRPDREELKQQVRHKTFVELSKIYGVSDKAIVKWCIAYGLPYRKRDIKKYSDSDWELI